MRPTNEFCWAGSRYWGKHGSRWALEVTGLLKFDEFCNQCVVQGRKQGSVSHEIPECSIDPGRRIRREENCSLNFWCESMGSGQFIHTQRCSFRKTRQSMSNMSHSIKIVTYLAPSCELRSPHASSDLRGSSMLTAAWGLCLHDDICEGEGRGGEDVCSQRLRKTCQTQYIQLRL